MREQKRFSVRFALTNPQHVKAWELLSQQQEGQKNDFVIAAILGNTDMRQVVREEIRAALLEAGPVPARATVREVESPQEIPSDILDFLQSL